MAQEEKDKKTEPSDQVTLYISKRHKVLQDLSTELSGTQLSEEFEVCGRTFVISTLDSEEELWADSLTQSNSPLAAATSFKLSRIAASIRSVNGVSASELFPPPENMPENTKKLVIDSRYERRNWEMSQMMIWLGEQPIDMANDIVARYRKLSERRKEAWEALKKSSARTPGSSSKDTSSPERESSQAVQM